MVCFKLVSKEKVGFGMLVQVLIVFVPSKTPLLVKNISFLLLVITEDVLKLSQLEFHVVFRRDKVCFDCKFTAPALLAATLIEIAPSL